MHKLPNLYRNRLDTYYLRIKTNGREVKRSLGTKEPTLAKKAALAFALAKVDGTIAVADRSTIGGPQVAHLPTSATQLITLRNFIGMRLPPYGWRHQQPAWPQAMVVVLNVSTKAVNGTFVQSQTPCP